MTTATATSTTTAATPFIRENFTYHGGYLMYNGDCGEFNEYYQEPCHPTRLGTRKEAFVARFKYGKSRKASFLTFLIKNVTVEEYFARMADDETPIGIVESKGYAPRTRR